MQLLTIARKRKYLGDAEQSGNPTPPYPKTPRTRAQTGNLYEEKDAEAADVLNLTGNTGDQGDTNSQQVPGHRAVLTEFSTRDVYIVTKLRSEGSMDGVKSTIGIYETASDANEAARRCLYEGDCAGFEFENYKETPREDGTTSVHAESAEIVAVNHDVTVEKRSLFCRPAGSAKPAESRKSPPIFVYMVEKTDTTLQRTGDPNIPYESIDDKEKLGPFKDIETANACATREHQSNIGRNRAVPEVEYDKNKDKDRHENRSDLKHSCFVDDDGLFYGSIVDHFAGVESYMVDVVKQPIL